ncbi:MAG: TlpA disulfide reductase family protein [Pseudomonadota bacterium]
MFRNFVSAALIMASLGVTSPALAGDLAALQVGEMRKLVVHGSPKAPVTDGFLTVDDAPMDMGNYTGKVVILNFWATWCAPCRKEMPALNALQEKFGGDDFAVVTVATGRNPVPAMRRFFEETDIRELPLHRDPRQAFARSYSVFGLPTTIVLDPGGHEIARLRGDAEWFSEEAQALVAHLIENPGS